MSPKLNPARLSATALSQHLLTKSAATRKLVRALRKTILSAAPAATEAIKFHVLCYFHNDSFFGSIGGNICMIEIKKNQILLSFIHGAALPDSKCLLYGSGKNKRFMKIPDHAAATSKHTVALIKAAAKLRPWD